MGKPITDEYLLRDIRAREKEAQEWHCSCSVAGFLIGLVLLPVNPLVAIACMVGGDAVDVARSALGTHINLATRRMPDGWLAQVAEREEVSREGIRELSKALERKGHITVAEALAWAERESKRTDTRARVREVGAAKLTERALREAGRADLWERAQRVGEGATDAALAGIRRAGITAAEVCGEFAGGVWDTLKKKL